VLAPPSRARHRQPYPLGNAEPIEGLLESAGWWNSAWRQTTGISAPSPGWRPGGLTAPLPAPASPFGWGPRWPGPRPGAIDGPERRRIRGIGAQSVLVAFQLFAANVRKINVFLTKRVPDQASS
jgi:hypothetical protein